MNNVVELLAPAGDFECLVAAIQNGADAVYFGANRFNARANSTNFNDEELIKAISYAKLRNVKTHLTLNILIKNDEFQSAMQLVNLAYMAGIDAIIVQDLGLARKIIENFPNLEVHSSTQMTTYNLQGVKELENLGFKRVVLSRELTLKQIDEICKNTKIEVEVFIHGALCISYSGQCLMSSIIGGRSGNRGKCAGTCRMPYELIEKSERRIIDKGYLLSSKDLCSLELLPELIKTGVKSFKIEGRMKSPEYVGIVTAIYRKYIDLAQSNEKYVIDDKDKQKLMQIFNRGGFSTGYLKGKLGKEMIYSKRPNHIGVYIGKVLFYNQNKGYIKFKAENEIDLGDSIRIGEESCKISELMKQNNNIKIANIGELITVGRIVGNIKIGDSIYKTVSIRLSKEIKNSYLKENIKRKIDVKITLHENEKLKIKVLDKKLGITVNLESEAIVSKTEKTGITEQRIIEQLTKTGNTIFEMENVIVDMDSNIAISISSINEIRRLSLDKLENEILNSFKRKERNVIVDSFKKLDITNKSQEVSVLFNTLNKNINYTDFSNIDNVYIPLNLFFEKDLNDVINKICNKFKTYIYMPTITNGNYELLLNSNFNEIIKNNIYGIVISNISQLDLVKNCKNKLDVIANYTMNVSNDNSTLELQKMNFSKVILSPELDKINLINIKANKEVIVYGRALLMTSEYCPIGIGKNCDGKCKKGNYILKDRLGFEFPIYTDRINCCSKIYNSKITSLEWEESDSIRIDIIDETEEEIKNIIYVHKQGKRLEGQQYTNLNLYKEI